MRFGGSGGQGAVLAATVLGEAAVASGLHAAGSSAYGSQARGGAASSDLIVSREVIDYPHVSRPDIFVALSREAYAESRASTAEGGVIVYDSFFVEPEDLPGRTQAAVPATEIVLEKIGARQGANMFMVGVVVGMTGIVEDGPVLEAVRSNLDARFYENAGKAYEMGKTFAASMEKDGGR